VIDAEALRFLNGYERYATTRILDAAADIDGATWSKANEIGERGMGGILVHHLGAYQRWRHFLSGSPEEPRPEDEPLLNVDGLRARWAPEWDAFDAWLARLTEVDLRQEHEGTTLWQALLHVFNHGTQHRSEVAALLTAAGRSPGDLDLIDYADELARIRG
jgi:uncharacterized damage-inducible protein DinB